MTDPASRPRKALVIGAGPVGALTALSLHRRGWEVAVWDMREDPRGKATSFANQRSINLNISNRGLEALRSVDPSLAETMRTEAIPMYGRMIHHLDGHLESQSYDPIGGQAGWSISRPVLNQRLVEALPDDVTFRFNTKLGHIDFRKRVAYGVGVAKKVAPGQEDDDGRIAGDGKVKEYKSGEEDREGTGFDLVIGCDGTWSKVRSEMMRAERIDFSQSFIQHAYIELHMPSDPAKPGGFKMDPNHLHIWPRHSFMLIGLPNTATLELAGEEQLLNDLLENPRGNLVETHVLPSAWSSHAILLGDASHSMVPFYGQGLNCGLEDVRVFNSYLENYAVGATTSRPLGDTDPQLAKTLAAYSSERDKDLRAICQLAMQNYVEMRSRVLSPLHLLRRQIDSLLAHIFPSHPTAPLSLTNPFPTQKVRGWTSLYHLVTFRADVPYSQALERERWQQGVVAWLARAVGGVGLAGVGYGAWVGWKLIKRGLDRA